MSSSTSHSPDGAKLVRVASTRNLVEAEMIEGLLSDAGIPCVVQRSVDNPEFLASGPRDVRVPADRAAEAREMLGETVLDAGQQPEETSPAALAIWIGAVFLGGLILAWILYQLT